MGDSEVNLAETLKATIANVQGEYSSLRFVLGRVQI